MQIAIPFNFYRMCCKFCTDLHLHIISPSSITDVSEKKFILCNLPGYKTAHKSCHLSCFSAARTKCFCSPPPRKSQPNEDSSPVDWSSIVISNRELPLKFGGLHSIDWGVGGEGEVGIISAIWGKQQDDSWLLMHDCVWLCAHCIVAEKNNTAM